MSHKKRGALIISIFTASTMLLSACTQSLSSAPAKTPTVIPPSLFVTPIASAGNPMAAVEQFAKQTAAAQTALAGGGATSTPQAIASASGASATPQPGGATLTIPNTPTNAAAAATTATTPASLSPSLSNVTPGVRPATYNLQEGEFPYCIARRFDVDPEQLCTLSGISCADNNYSAGQPLKIPQSGHFPGDRARLSHPTTYTVVAGETLYSIACKFGDVYPEAIASLNGISVSAKPTAGQSIKIP